VGHADHLQSNVMNSCGNSNISTRLRGSKCVETPDESINQIGEIEKEGSGVISGYSINELNVPRSTLVICQRNSNYSSDHGFTRFKPRFFYFFIRLNSMLSSVLSINEIVTM